MIPPQQQWPRGPRSELHKAAYRGSVNLTLARLWRESDNTDQGDPRGYTPLMLAAQEGHSRVVRILLDRGANVSIAQNGGFSALHLSAQEGHLAVTVDLAKAGADLDAMTNDGATPLHLAAQNGNSAVMVALIEACADVDSRMRDGRTPLYEAAVRGRLNAVRELIRAKADPSLVRILKWGQTNVPLDTAAECGNSNVVRELIQQFGIKGCGGESDGVDALAMAARGAHLDIMAMLINAGVVDTGLAVVYIAGWGSEVAVKFMLQQRQREASPTDLVEYVNCRDDSGATALFSSTVICSIASGMPRLASPRVRVVQLLVEAGADTSLELQVTNGGDGGVNNLGTPLAYTDDILHEKKVQRRDATEDELHRLEAVRRLLLRVEAVRAVSWLWHSDTPSIAHGEGDTRRTAKTTPASSTPLMLMMPLLKSRRRGALLAPLLRYSSHL